MSEEKKKLEFAENLKRRLPHLGKDNHGRWFVAKEVDGSISIEIVESEEAGNQRMKELSGTQN